MTKLADFLTTIVNQQEAVRLDLLFPEGEHINAATPHQNEFLVSALAFMQLAEAQLKLALLEEAKK